MIGAHPWITFIVPQDDADGQQPVAVGAVASMIDPSALAGWCVDKLARFQQLALAAAA